MTIQLLTTAENQLLSNTAHTQKLSYSSTALSFKQKLPYAVCDAHIRENMTTDFVLITHIIRMQFSGPAGWTEVRMSSLIIIIRNLYSAIMPLGGYRAYIQGGPKK